MTGGFTEDWGSGYRFLQTLSDYFGYISVNVGKFKTIHPRAIHDKFLKSF